MPIEHPIFKEIDNQDENMEFLRPGSLIKKEEFFRLISQALREHGYK